MVQRQRRVCRPELSNPRDALAKHVDSEDVAKRDTPTAGGVQIQNHINESGLYSLILGSTKDAAKRFKRWVTAEVLPTIRKTGGYGSSLPVVAPVSVPTIDAFKLTPLVVRAARALGLDKNAAAISANQAVAKLTGTNVLGLLGVTHLEAENQKSMAYTPTELGARLGISARKLNALLETIGLQVKDGDQWRPTAKADGFFRLFDTGKRHSDGTPVQQMKWHDSVLSLIDCAAE